MNETELIYASILDCSRTDLYLKNRPLSLYERLKLSSVIRKRNKGVPLQHILGAVDFMGFEIKVNKDVFIPRPETEILVEEAAKLIKAESKKRNLRILDIGTGSGCIAIVLSKLFSEAEIDASDISKKALAIARQNAIKNSARINFIESDFFSNNFFRDKKYDFIVTNPPYILTDEIKNLQAELQFEPAVALDGGKDGVSFYKKIIEGSKDHLEEGSFLAFEIGYGQAGIIRTLIKESGYLAIDDLIKDYNGIDRVLIASKKVN